MDLESQHAHARSSSTPALDPARLVYAVPPRTPAIHAAIDPRAEKPTAALLRAARLREGDRGVMMAIVAHDVVHATAVCVVRFRNGYVPPLVLWA